MKKIIIGTLVLASVIGINAPLRAQESAPAMEAAKAPEEAFAKFIVAESDIKSVTVYNNRAKITRTAILRIPAGAHTLAFKDLPPSLLSDSLRAEGSAQATVKFGAVSSKTVMSTDLASPRAAELSAKLEDLNDQTVQISAERAATDAKLAFLKSVGAQAQLRTDEDIAEINLKPDQWTAAAATLASGVLAGQKEYAAQDIRQRSLSREVDKTRRELQQLQSGGQRATFAVTVPLESDKPTELTIELSYQVPNATWEPTYDARLSSEGKGSLDLVQYGTVRQTTGEDWTGVALTLSTAQPQRGASLPDTTPLWVDAYQAGNFPSIRATPGAGADVEYLDTVKRENTQSIVAASNMADSLSPAEAPVAPPPPQKAAFVSAEINTGGFVSEYKIAGPATVPSDGSETKLMVGTFDTESKREIHIKPQMSTEAYLVAKCKLKGDSPALPGKVSLFRDGAFVGQSQIPLVRPGEEYGLYFGIDDQVSVKRKTLKDVASENGVIAKDTVLERNFVTEIQNLHKDAVDIVVKEATPVSRNEKVRVDILKEKTTEGYVADSANIKGLLQWSFAMQPKEKKELNLGWTISYPAGMTLSGL